MMHDGALGQPIGGGMGLGHRERGAVLVQANLDQVARYVRDYSQPVDSQHFYGYEQIAPHTRDPAR